MYDATFIKGLFAGILLMLGGQAGHWFITPLAHPDASTLRHVLVALQAVIGFGGGAWFFSAARKSRA